ncbi:MAG TPA: hypothetical protein VJV79_36555 [Polyangiaceae bacterium]|nr:hypothetical protein [Polyangiaceae bacterium]
MSLAAIGCGAGASEPSATAGAASLAGAGALPSAGGAAGTSANAGGNTGSLAGSAGSSGARASGGSTASDPFWTASPALPKISKEKQVVVFSETRWALVIPRYGDSLRQATFLTRNAGVTWTELSTGFRNEQYVDHFRFLGKGPNGELYGKWSHPDPCDECAALGAPGAPGDTTLLRYDWDAARFEVVDAMPADVIWRYNSGGNGTLVSNGSGMWFYTDATGSRSSQLWRFEGPGQWLSIPTPAVAQMLATPQGTLYCMGPDDLAQRLDGAEFEAIAMPELTSVWGIGADPQGRLYASFTDRAGVASIVRHEANSWLDVSPIPASNSFQPWTFAISEEGIMIAATSVNDTKRIRSFISKDLGTTWIERSPLLITPQNPFEFGFGAQSRPYFVSGYAEMPGQEAVWYGPPASDF